MTPIRLYVLQRASAVVMIPLLLAHLALIFYATHDGLTAGEILSRTQGSVFWALFYGTFVIAAAVHAAIGLRSVSADWLTRNPRTLDLVLYGTFMVLLLLGLRAVWAVVFPGSA
ncbi:MAG: succinate dehydrogenase [Pseudomonadota bacterium]